jgi:DmsE family decaheme c-type cytochrome
MQHHRLMTAAAVLVFILSGSLKALAQEPATKQDFIGSEACTAKCHQNWAATFRVNVHRQTEVDKHAPLSKRGCEACHGPSALHKQAVELDETDLKIAALGKMPARQLNTTCLSCHTRDIPRSRWEDSPHAAKGLACRDCHQIHQERGKVQTHLLKQSINDLCLSCHQNQKAHFRLNSHHPLIEGRINCTDCHNPHHADDLQRLSLRADERCVTCHTDKRGPFIFVHDMTGVGEGCQTCHRPHGSPNTKLTKLNGRALCLQCHSDINADPEHRLRPGNCWSAGCHADLHGSQTSRLFIPTGARALRSPVRRSVAPAFGANSTLHRRTELSDFLAMLAQATPEKPPEPVAEEEKKPADRRFDVETISSFQNLGVDGNRSKYHQYNVKPDGLFSEMLRLHLFDGTGFGFGKLLWTGVDEPGQTVALRLDSLARAPSLLRYDYSRASFFIEPSLDPRTVSERKEHHALLRVLSPNNAPSLDFVFNRQQVDAPGLSRLTTGGVPGSLNYRTTAFGPTLRAPLAGGDLSLQYLRDTFTDDSGFLPRASTHSWQLSYDRAVGAKTTAFASLSDVRTRQSGLPGPAKNRQVRVGAVSSLLRNVTVSALLNVEDVDLPHTLNAFIVDNDSFTLRVRYHPEARLTFEGGYERVNLRRLNNPQNFVDTPEWDGGWFSVRAMPHRNVTLLLRHRQRRLDDIPLSDIAALPTTMPLFFDEDDRTDAQLTILLPRDALLYANYGRAKRDNDARRVGFRLNTLNLGLAMPLSQHLSFNVDWNRQNWTGRGDALNNDPLLLNFGRPPTSDGDHVNVGWVYVTGKNTVTANLYRFTSSGGESVRGRGGAIGYERFLNDRLSGRVQLVWDDYDDRVLPGFNNSDSFVRIDLIRRF